MSHIEHNTSEDQTGDYPIPLNYDPLRGALVDIIALSKGTFPTNARRLGDIHNRARAALGELPITILAQPTPALTPTPDPLREVAQAFIDHVVAETKTHTGCPQRLALDRALAQPSPALDVERLREAIRYGIERQLGPGSATTFDVAIGAAVARYALRGGPA